MERQTPVSTKSIALTLLASYLSFQRSEAYMATSYKRKAPVKDFSRIVASDSSKVGTLKVPNVGIGTISWSSESCKLTLLVIRTVHAFNESLTDLHVLMSRTLFSKQCLTWKMKSWKSLSPPPTKKIQYSLTLLKDMAHMQRLHWALVMGRQKN